MGNDMSTTIPYRMKSDGSQAEPELPPFALPMDGHEAQKIQKAEAASDSDKYLARRAFRQKVHDSEFLTADGLPGWDFWRCARKENFEGVTASGRKTSKGRNISCYETRRQKQLHPEMFHELSAEWKWRKGELDHLIQLRDEVRAKQQSDPKFRRSIPEYDILSEDEIFCIVSERSRERLENGGQGLVYGFSQRGLTALLDIDENFDTWARYTDDFDLLEGAWFNGMGIR